MSRRDGVLPHICSPLPIVERVSQRQSAPAHLQSSPQLPACPGGMERSSTNAARERSSASYVSPFAGVQRVQPLGPSLGREGLGGFEKLLNMFFEFELFEMVCAFQTPFEGRVENPQRARAPV